MPDSNWMTPSTPAVLAFEYPALANALARDAATSLGVTVVPVAVVTVVSVSSVQSAVSVMVAAAMVVMPAGAATTTMANASSRTSTGGLAASRRGRRRFIHARLCGRDAYKAGRLTIEKGDHTHGRDDRGHAPPGRRH